MPLSINTQQDEEERRRREQQQNMQNQQQTALAQRIQENSTPQLTQPQNAQQSLMRREDPTTVKWYKGEQPTSSELLARIYTIGQQDRAAGEEMYKAFTAARQDPTSPIYDAYSKGTNYAITALSELGVDMSGGVTPEWLQENQGYLQHLKYTQAGNVQAPTKRSSREEKIAYQMYQLFQDEDLTEQAEAEWRAYQEEVAYWATRDDLNLSNEEIMAKIDPSKYKTLAKMDANRENPISLNRAVGYNQDAISGVIWAARNGVDLNDPYNSVRAALGQGKQYAPDEELRQRLTPGSSTYAPYSVCTLDDAALYFGVDSFDQQWLNDHMAYRDSNDETARSMYNSVYKAELTTRKAEEEMAALREVLDKKLKSSTDPDRVLKAINWEKGYPTLYAMNETLNGGPKLMTTRGIDFSQDAIKKEIADKCQHNKLAKTGRALCEWFSDFTGIPVEYDENLIAINQNRSNNIQTGSETIETNGTPEEQVVFNSGSSPTQDADMLALSDNLDSPNFDGQKGYNYIYDEADKYAVQNYLGAHAVITKYENNDNRLNEIEDEFYLLDHGIIPGEDIIGRWGQGNIDLFNRPTYRQEDGSVSTVNSISFYDEQTGKEILIPTIVNGKQVSDDEAIDHYYETGEYLGKFDTPEEADAYAIRLHDEQELLYPNDTPSTSGSNLGLFTTANTLGGGSRAMSAEVKELLTELKARGIDNPLSPNLTEEQRRIVDEVIAAHAGTEKTQSAFVAKDVEKEKQIQAEQNRLMAEQSKLKAENESNASAYQEAVQTRDNVIDNYVAADTVAGLTDTQRDGGYKMPTTLDRYYELGAKREPTQWNSDNLYDLALQNGDSYEEVSRAAVFGKYQYQSEIAEIDSILKYLDSFDYPFSDEYYQNIMARRSYLTREVQAANDFLLQGKADYQEKVDEQIEDFKKLMEDPKARATAQFVGVNGGLAAGMDNNGLSSISQEILLQESGLWKELGIKRSANPLAANTASLTEDMTSRERKNYIYILATKGEDAAKAFYDRLTDDTYGVVTTRAAKTFEETFKQFGQEHPGAASVLSIIMSPFGAASNAVYTLGQKIKGEEASPYNMASYSTIAKEALQGAATEEVQKWANDTFGEGTIGSTLVNIVYSGGMSAANSLVNNFVYGGLDFGSKAATGLSKFLRTGAESFISASPMGFGAADAAIRDVELRHGTTDQALIAGAVTFLCETATEAVTLENIGEARNFGKAGDFKSYMWNAITKYLDEPLAEGLNQAIEDLSDDWIMGEDGKRHTRIAELIESGMSQEDAEQQAWMEFMGQIGVAMATAAISSGVSTGVSWLNGRLTGSNQTTPEQREQQVDERGNVAEPTEYEGRHAGEEFRKRTQYYEGRHSVQTEEGAQEAAENVARVDENGNVVEPTEGEYTPRHVSTEQREQQVEDRGNVVEPTEYEGRHEATPDPHEVVVSETESNYPGRHKPAPEVVVSQPIQNGSRVARQIEMLSMADSINPSGQAAAMGAVLMPSTQRDLFSTGLASAAGQHLQDKYGTSAVRMLRRAVTTAARNGVDINNVTFLMAEAALADEGSATAQALDILVQESEATGTTSPEALQTFQAIAMMDMTPDKLTAMRKKVEEHLTASKIRDYIAEGALNGVGPFEIALGHAMQEQQNASEALKREENTRDQMQEDLKNKHKDFIEDPGNTRKKDAVNRATNDLDGQNKVVEEYGMRKDNADRVVVEAQKDLDQKRNELLTPLREQAAAEVQQELQADQQRQADEAAAAQAAQQAQQAAEQEAQHQQTLQDQRSGKLKEESTRAKLERRAQQKGLTGKAAENYVNSVLQHARDRELNKTDMNKPLSALDADLFMGNLERRFGVKVRAEELADGINGFYDRDTDSITLNKKLPAGQVLVEFGLHELTHSLEKTGAYQQYHDTALNILFPTQAEMDSAVADKIASYDAQGIRIDRAQALREIVADFTRTRLNSADVVQRMVDGGLGGRMRAALHNINQFLRNKLTRMDPETRRTAENLRRAERMFQKALNEKEKANKQKIDEMNRQANTPEGIAARAAKPMTTNAEGEALTATLNDGTVTREYSATSWTDAEKARVKKDLMATGQYDEEAADRWVNDLNSVAAIVLADRTRLDYVGDPEKTMVKPNSDYGASLDASTLCPKRLLYQGTFDAIQHRLPNTALLPTDLIDLTNTLRVMGYESPCAICYVESRRRNLGKFTQEWLDEYDGEYKPRIEELTTTDGLEQLKKEHRQAYEDFNTAMDHLNQNNPKVVQLRTDYRGEISKLSDKAIQKAINNGGFRVSSFSDFEIPHLLDMMQAVGDMAARKTTAQAYAKVQALPAVFGDTGMKINLSLIGKGKGVDADGHLIFDDVEGMPYKDALELRGKHSANVGTILVGMNDDHIIAAMADPTIDFIIPFHRSGWTNEEMKKIAQLRGYKNYTNGQNERVIIEKKIVTAKKNVGQKAVDNWVAKNKETYPDYQITQDENGKFTITHTKGYVTESFLKHAKRTGENLGNYQPVGENKYWDFEVSGQKNAETYLEKCKKDGRMPKFSEFLVDNGDGSFSLPQGDDPRSKAIREGYWKTLIDFKMYDNEGVGAPQKPVTLNVDMEEAKKILAGYSLGRKQPNGQTVYRANNNTLPVAQDVVDAYVQQYMDKHPGQEYSAGMGEMTTAQLEQAYQEAVSNGDDQMTQDIVEEAAYTKGYTDLAYHGTNSFGFTQFDMDASQGMIFVAYDDVLAGTYTDTRADVRRINDAGRTIDTLTDEELYALADDRLKTITKEDGKMYRAKVFYGDEPGTFTLRTVPTAFASNASREDQTITTDQLREYLRPTYEKMSTNGIYKFYTRPGNQLVVDANDEAWNAIPFDLYDRPVTGRFNAFGDFEEYVEQGDIDDDEPHDFTATTREIANWAKEHGYDSVRINNVYDSGGRSYRRRDHEDGYGDIGIFFNQDDVKSADTIVYDDNGNVIPLSERFSDSNDIRYSAGDGAMTEEQMDQELIEAGVITPEELPPQRQFGRVTAQNSDLDERVKEHLYNNSAYTPDTNRAQINRAIEWIHQMADKDDPSGFQNALQTVFDGTFNPHGADGTARLLTLMSLAATQGSLNDQIRLADFYNREGTTAGQQMQARKMIRLMTPIGRIALLKQQANKLTDELARKGIKKEITLSDWTLQAAAEAKTEGDFDKVRKAANEELADQLPVSWKERLQSWRMLAMLANPRTHVRNLVGNALFVPAVSLKNKIGAAMELSKPVGERTKTLSATLAPDIKDFARQDAITMKDVLTGEAKYNDRTAVQRNKQTLPGFLQAASDFNSGLLEKEDWFFLKGHYRRALGGWMQANGYTPAQLLANPDLLQKGRDYAVQEAQKATYRDANQLAKTLSEVSRKGGALGMFVDAVLPFKKTPANILKRGIEYSPVGLIKSLTADAVHLKQYRDWQNGQYSKMPDKAISPNQWIDNICSGLSGSAIFALGMVLSNMGVISVGLDDDDDEFDKLEGDQEYSVKIFGHSYTLDWAAPACMPFFVGAAVRELSEREGGFDAQEALNAAANIAEPVFNLSMLDGVNSLFRTSQNDETNNLTQILAKVGTNYATSFWPSIIGAAARAADPVRRKAFVKSGETGGILGQIRYAKEQTENKIPGLSQTNIPNRDAFGRVEADNLVEKILENFISPGYHTTMQNDPVVEELRNLYETTGNRSMIPKLPNKTLTVNKQSIALEAEEYDKLTEERGSTAYRILSELMNSDFYKDASEKDRADMVTDAWTYATQTANRSVNAGYKMDTWVTNSMKNPTRSIINRCKDRVEKDYKDGCKIAAVEAVESEDFEALDTVIAKYEEAGGKKSQIKTAVGNAYKEEYLRAYQADDYATMDEIEVLLESTDLGFNEAYFQKWIDNVENQIRDDEEEE